MRSWTGWRLAASAACVAGAIACSDDGDPDTDIDSLQGQAGSGVGGSSGAGGGAVAGSGGMSMGGRGGAGGSPGGNAGSPSTSGGAGGNPAGGSGGAAGSAAGSGGAAGGDTAPDAGGGDPEPEVGFSQVFPVVVLRCGNCHGANAANGRPRFAQANNEAASFAATQLMSQGDPVFERMVFRAVEERDMPPDCDEGALGTPDCLSVAQADLLQAWVEQGAQE